jgi:hypothetical protein
MATPARIVRLQCPACRRGQWDIDNDFRGSSLGGLPELGYEERRYQCSQCGYVGAGFSVRLKLPTTIDLGMMCFRCLAWLLVPSGRRRVPPDADGAATKEPVRGGTQ